jgi:hypothetical protein
MRAKLFGFHELPARHGDFLVRQYEPGDEHEILATFNRVFGRIDVTFRPRTLAFWRWRFLENPSGAKMMLAFTPEGRVAGQLAVIVNRVRLEGRPSNFAQGVDQMSDASLRTGLARGSLVGVLGNSMVNFFAGPGPEQHSLGWGAPVPAAWRAGKSFARYEIVRTQLKLVAEPGEVRAGAASGVELTEVREFPQEVGELSERAARVHGAIAVRDKPQLDWRWVRHPEKRCRIALARRGRELVGYAVAARGDFDGKQGEWLLLDWLVDAGDEAAGNALRAWLAGLAAREPARIAAVFPDSKCEWLDFQRAGFRVAPTRYFLIARQYLRGYDVHWMHRHWYYTLGDTDLV